MFDGFHIRDIEHEYENNGEFRRMCKFLIRYKDRKVGDDNFNTQDYEFLFDMFDYTFDKRYIDFCLNSHWQDTTWEDRGFNLSRREVVDRLAFWYYAGKRDHLAEVLNMPIDYFTDWLDTKDGSARYSISPFMSITAVLKDGYTFDDVAYAVRCDTEVLEEWYYKTAKREEYKGLVYKRFLCYKDPYLDAAAEFIFEGQFMKSNETLNICKAKNINVTEFLPKTVSEEVADDYINACSRSNCCDFTWVQAGLMYSKREVAERLMDAFYSMDTKAFSEVIDMPEEFLRKWLYTEDGSSKYGQSPFYIITKLMGKGYELENISKALNQDYGQIKEWYAKAKPLYVDGLYKGQGEKC